MSNYPENLDVFVDKTGSDNIASSDPNNAFDGIEATEGFLGALGKPQSWSTTLITLLREYQRGMNVTISSAVPVVRAGECVLENTDGSRWVFRRNPTDTTLSATNIDAGTLIATSYYIYAKGGTAATTTPIVFSTDAYAPSAIGTAPYRKIGWFKNTAIGSLAATVGGGNQAGQVVGFVDFNAVIVASGTTVVPNDDSKPENDEGDEYYSIPYTPTNVNNKLIINIYFQGSISTENAYIVGLFQDATVEAINAVKCNVSNNGVINPVPLRHSMTAATTTEIIFKVRAGPVGAATLTMNGESSARILGGGTVSSISVMEIQS